MARPGGGCTRGPTRAALEGVGEADSGAGVDDCWIGVGAQVLMVT